MAVVVAALRGVLRIAENPPVPPSPPPRISPFTVDGVDHPADVAAGREWFNASGAEMTWTRGGCARLSTVGPAPDTQLVETRVLLLCYSRLHVCVL